MSENNEKPQSAEQILNDIKDKVAWEFNKENWSELLYWGSSSTGFEYPEAIDRVVELYHQSRNSGLEAKRTAYKKQITELNSWVDHYRDLSNRQRDKMKAGGKILDEMRAKCKKQEEALREIANYGSHSGSTMKYIATEALKPKE